MAQTTTTRLETLSRDNYDTWRIQAEALLVKNDHWGYVSGEEEQPVVEGAGDALAAAQAASKAWLINDRKAKADLILAINPSELTQIRGCITSRDVWVKLESIYASKGPARKATLLKRLVQQKMQDGDDVSKHLSEFFDAVDKLKSMEIDINGELMTIMLLYSLPISFENFRIAIESRDKLPDAEALKIKIIEEYNAREKSSDSGAAMFAKGQASSSKNKFRRGNKGGANGGKGGGSTNDGSGTNKGRMDDKRHLKCGFCNKARHTESECWKKAALKNKTDEVHCAYLIGKGHEAKSAEKLWCLDSGCTSHLCKDASAFQSVTRKAGQLKLADNSVAQVAGKGDVRIAIADSSGGTVTLKDTLFVPKLRSNLLSISKIVDRGSAVTFKKSCAVVKDSFGNTKLIAERIGDLYFLRAEEQRAMAVSEVIEPESDVKTWHNRLGHLNARDLSLLARSGSVKGLTIKSIVDEIKCDTCLSAKISCAPFGPREKRTSELLELIHTDLCGPMRTHSVGGARYFMTFIDDYSRVCMVYFLAKKSDAVQKFRDYKNLVENQLGRKIKALQSDGGTEYTNKEMENLLRTSGIAHRMTTAHTPQQNGVAERRNRTLVEAARCMQIDAKLPPSLWAEAIAAANYVRNRCPSKSLPDGVTPIELWTGEKPNLSRLRSFGEKAFVLDKTPGKGKFDPKGIMGFFVGYSEKSKAHRIWIPRERKIRESRDVKFLNEFQPDPSQRPKAPLEHQKPPPDDDEAEKRTYLDIALDASATKLPNHPHRPHVNEPVEEIDDEEDLDPFYGFDDEPGQEVPDPDGAAEQQPTPGRGPAKRGPGRPKIVRTGERGRPSKKYHEAGIAEDSNDEGRALTPDQSEVNESEDEDLVDDSDRSEDNEVAHQADQCVAMTAMEVPLNNALDGEDKDEWFEAIYSEAKCLVANNTWKLVDRPVNHNVISCRTVLRNKFNPDGSLDRRKARVVARGFAQRPGIDFTDTFAPVARLDSFRFLLALAAKFNLQISQLDITTAYLNGEMDTKVYMEPPVLLRESLERMVATERDETLVAKAEQMLKALKSGDKVCLLVKALYGLRQAGRQWHAKVNSTFKSVGLAPTESDPCVYVDHRSGGSTYVLLYVDDIVIMSNNPERVDEIKNHLSAEYQMKDLGRIKYCLGIEVEQDKNKVSICQSGYIREILDKFGMSDCKAVKSPLAAGTKLEASTGENEAKFPYRELIGALMYLAIGTRPDIAYAVNMLSQFNCAHDQAHWLAAKRVLRYLKGTVDRKLVYTRDQNGIIGHADADWGNCPIDRVSYSGYSFSLSGAAISWHSRKQRIVALSSTEAEYVSLSEAMREAIHLSNFAKELRRGRLSEITVYNDNQSAAKLVYNPVFHARTKHVDIKFHFVRKAVQIYPLRVEFMPTEEMTADVLTKPLCGVKLENCSRGLGLRDC